MTNSEPPHPPRSTHCGTLPLPTSNPAATRADYLRAGGAVLLFLLPCLPFLFSGVIWFPDRGVLVAEYLVVGIVAPIARRWLIALLVIAFVVADLLYTLGKTFFYSPLLYVKSIPFSQLLNIATVESALYIIASAAAVFVAFQIGYWGARLSNKYSSAFLSFLLVIFICLDALNDSGGFIKANGIRVVSANILSSSFLQIVLNVRRELASQSKDAELIMGATGIYRDNLSQLDGTRNLVLIIVESLGLPVQSRHTKFLFDSLERLSAQRRVLKGSIPFKGATTAAEMRELCFSSLDYRHLTRDTESPWPCLPQELQRRGYRTIGFHGFSSGMFNRRGWWPLTGLQILKFGNDLSDKYSRRCGGAFRGICDEDILAVAVSNLSEPGQFVYLLTLNTHLPMYKAAGDESTGGCNELQINNAVGECLLMLRLKKILDNISEHVKATKMRTDWIIVGDHAPPFSNRSEREHFDNARVPYFIIFSE